MEAAPVETTNPPQRVKDPKRVEAGRAAAAKRKAAREEESKILEQLQASKTELQQLPDNATHNSHVGTTSG